MKQKMSKIKEAILNLIYPKNIKCMFCTGELNQNSYNTTCEECLKILPFITKPCERCGSQLKENQQGVCINCKKRNYNFIQARSVFEYVDKPLAVVHNSKYNDKKYLLEYMVKYLLDVYATWNVFADFITCVPMFETKEKARGYNQSKVLAELFAEKVKIPFVEFCAKAVDTPSQTNLNTRERLENVKDSFAFKPEYNKLIKNKVVLIIDDVITTCATTSEVAKTLLEAGAKECYVLSFAHTTLNEITTEN